MLTRFYPTDYADSVFDIDYKALYAKGYRGLLLDIDNTFVHHGDPSTPEVDALIRAIQDMGFATLFLTNNNAERAQRFLTHIDSPFLCEAGKPEPAGFLRGVSLLGLPKEQVLCIGDQMFVDILGANRAGLDSILVHYIQQPGETKVGKKRVLEQYLLKCYLRQRKKPMGKRKRFCDINPTCYAISTQKEIFRRNLRDYRHKIPFACTLQKEPLPCLVSHTSNRLIKVGPGIDPVLQENKAVNIDLACQTMHGLLIRPGEVFSFWTRIGKPSKSRGFKDGRVIIANRIRPGTGGGLCNLGNTIHWLVLHSPLEVIEWHSHSDALAPDEGPREPFHSGTSVSYNYIDFRFRNNSDQTVQLLVWCEEGRLWGELRSERPFPQVCGLLEEDHHFRKEGENYFRVSKIYKITEDRETGVLLDKRLVWDNHSEVMFDDSLIPKDQIREEEKADGCVLSSKY